MKALSPSEITKGLPYLLQLVVDDAARNLEDEIVEMMRPKIRAHVTRALEDLKPRLESMLDPMERAMAIRLTVREMPEAGLEPARPKAGGT